MDHYRLTAEKTNPDSGHENGDVESAHRHFKDAVDQALMLRGSRDFESREDYAAFLRELLVQRNAGRRKRLAEERKELSPLPPRRLESFTRMRVQVIRGSLIRVQKNVYSVHSRLIGEQVDVRVYSDRLEVWYGQRRVDTLPRLRGSKKHYVNYRHIIDWLVRKPGAFEHYRYREDLFPTSRFRMAYDTLCERHASKVASREYLAILEMAARTGESAVDDALRFLITNNKEVNQEEVLRLVEQEEVVPSATDVVVDEPDLNDFDWLLDNREVFDGCEQGCEENVDCASAGVASAHVP
jgi:hypothetical protein